jgi:acetyltransferase-like isoleucine patch superfamily enzyme
LFNIAERILRRIFHALVYVLFQFPRMVKYRILSNCRDVVGRPIYNQPAILHGKGSIIFGGNVHIGVNLSPQLYSGYGYIESRNSNSRIIIGNDVWINNNIMLVSEGEGIVIGAKTLIGHNVEIVDSDFHALHPNMRMTGRGKTAKVSIGENVFIGSNVKILKGVSIGDNSVIGQGSIVTQSIPADVIAAGNPARVIKSIS